jgi:polyisoprenyl-phosphate glycosyltransferase
MKLVFLKDYPLGFPTLTLLVVFLGGMQLVAIGILGEYIGRIYDEVKQRPPYIVDSYINSPNLSGGTASQTAQETVQAPSQGSAELS